MWRHSLFRDRADAGRQLAEALMKYKNENPVVLALPRGGVPVAYEVARALEAPLDVLLVRKIGVPGHEELALGAVVDGSNPQVVLNERVMSAISLPPGYLESTLEGLLAEIERRRKLYRGDQPPIDVKGRTAIIVDDGIATGATMKAALRGVRQKGPARLILAVPVAPPDTIRELEAECDEIVCLETPEPFYAVGLYYADFSQVSDEEVINLLAKAQRLEETTHPGPPGDGQQVQGASQAPPRRA